jgi:hypothetical protein
MFSNTTMLSSTRMPTTSESAISVIRFKENPNRYMRMNVGIIAEGRATSTKRELRRLCRKMSITKPTINTANTRSSITALALESV